MSSRHLQELERRYRALEESLREAMSGPDADGWWISELKRHKLHIKEEIARLKRGGATDDRVAPWRQGDASHSPAPAKYPPHPSEVSVDFDTLYNKITSRFSKTISRLAE